MNKNDEIEEMVESMMRETTHNPRDYCFNYIVSRYPKASHESFGFPGKFIKSLDRTVYKEDGSKLELDIAELVGKDGFITQKSTINVEHQTTPIEYGKIDPIYDYKIHLIHQNNLPSISFVMTSLEHETEMKCYTSQNNVFNVYPIVVKEKDIYEKINILKNIDRNIEISQRKAMHFPYIAIFVKGDIEKDILEELCHIFTQVKMDTYLRLDIHHVLKIMIKEIFKDNKQKTKELVTMITKKLTEKEFCELTREEQFKADIARKNEIIENRDYMLAKKDEETQKKLAEKDEETKKIIAEKEKMLDEKDEETKKIIAEKDEEIKKLQQQIMLQNSK